MGAKENNRKNGNNISPDRESSPVRWTQSSTLYNVAVFYSDVVECWPVMQTARVRSPVGEKCYFHFFQLLHLAPTLNNPCVHKTPGVSFHVILGLLEIQGRISSWRGENVTGYRYMIHLYCLEVQADFYSDVVECRTLSPADRIRSPVGENVISIFSTVTRTSFAKISFRIRAF